MHIRPTMLPKRHKTPAELILLRNILNRLEMVPSDLIRGREAGLAGRLGKIIVDLSIAIDNAEEDDNGSHT